VLLRTGGEADGEIRFAVDVLLKNEKFTIIFT
jgi:hypothetical protein